MRRRRRAFHSARSVSCGPTRAAAPAGIHAANIAGAPRPTAASAGCCSISARIGSSAGFRNQPVKDLMQTSAPAIPLHSTLPNSAPTHPAAPCPLLSAIRTSPAAPSPSSSTPPPPARPAATGAGRAHRPLIHPQQLPRRLLNVQHDAETVIRTPAKRLQTRNLQCRLRRVPSCCRSRTPSTLVFYPRVI